MRIELKEADKYNKVPLKALVDFNSGLELAIKEAYRNISGLKKGAKTTELQVFASDFNNGSFLEVIAAQVDPEHLPLILGSFNQTELFTVLKNAIEYLKIWAQLKKNNKNVSVSLNDSPSSLVIIGNNISVGSFVSETATGLAGSQNSLLTPLKRGDLKQIKLTDVAGSQDLVLTENDSHCFELTTDLDKEEKIIVGDVVEFNKSTKTGTFKFVDDNKVCTKKFTLLNDEIMTTIDLMKKQICKMYCYEEFLSKPNGQKTVVKLRAIKFETM